MDTHHLLQTCAIHWNLKHHSPSHVPHPKCIHILAIFLFLKGLLEFFFINLLLHALSGLPAENVPSIRFHKRRTEATNNSQIWPSMSLLPFSWCFFWTLTRSPNVRLRFSLTNEMVRHPSYPRDLRSYSVRRRRRRRLIWNSHNRNKLRIFPFAEHVSLAWQL